MPQKLMRLASSTISSSVNISPKHSPMRSPLGGHRLKVLLDAICQVGERGASTGFSKSGQTGPSWNCKTDLKKLIIPNLKVLHGPCNIFLKGDLRPAVAWVTHKPYIFNTGAYSFMVGFYVYFAGRTNNLPIANNYIPQPSRDLTSNGNTVGIRSQGCMTVKYAVSYGN